MDGRKQKKILERERKIIYAYLTEQPCSFQEKLRLYQLQNPKCLELSKRYRIKATANLVRENHDTQIHELSWKLCTESLSKARGDSTAFAYNDRSNLMFHLRKYDECIKDIERALMITNDNHLKVELFCRKIECYVAMGVEVDTLLYEKAKLLLNNIHDNDTHRSKLIDLVKKARTTMEKNRTDVQRRRSREKLKATSSLVRIEYNHKYGRHLLANRDIRPGEIVFVEKFYTVTRNPRERFVYCSYCLNISWTLVPCPTCDLSMYCSENCKAKADLRYHDIECKVITPVMQLYPEFDFNCRLAVKLLILAYKEAGSIKKLRFDLVEIEACRDPRDRGLFEGKFRGSYKSVYSLSHPIQIEKLKYLTEQCAIALLAIAKYSHLLGYESESISAKELAMDRDALFLGALLLKFSLIVYANAIDFLENYTDVIIKEGKVHLKRMTEASRGQAMAPLTSLINHSCNPNVNKLYTDDARVIYYCILPIKVDTQIFDSYCPPFYSTWSKPDRNEYLMEHYQFQCKCEACVKDWKPAPSQKDDRTDHLELKTPDMNKDKITKMIFSKMAKYLRTISKSSDMQLQEATFRSIGEDIEILLKHVGFPSSQVTMFFYLLRLAYEKAHGCTRVVVPDTECRNW